MIVLMKDGEVIQVGSPEHILRYPANDFVKDFIGKKRLHNVDSVSSDLTVDDVMADNPVLAFPGRGMAEAIKMMEKRRVDSLIIVSKQKELLGHVTIFEVLNRYQEEDLKLGDMLKPFEHTVESGTSLALALALLTEHRLPYIPVVRGEQFIGLITKGSVVRHLADVYNPDEWSLAELTTQEEQRTEDRAGVNPTVETTTNAPEETESEKKTEVSAGRNGGRL
jgi:osmoprotectant transport system ATP-binding protein